MSVRKLILRSMAVAALGGAAFAAVDHFGFAALPVQAGDRSLVLTTTGPQTPTDAPVVEATMTPGPGTEQTMAADPSGDASVALSALGLPCGLSVTAAAMPGAMVALDVMDPCAPGVGVEITHGALRFTAQTDAMGLLTLDVPALETPAFFTVRLDSGAEATTLAGLPDLIDYDRAAIVWTGTGGLDLHAYRGDAAFGAPGHIWRDSPGSVIDATIGTAGFLTVLGDPDLADPQLAQVFTIPRAQRDDLSLVVEIPITEASCGQPVRAETLQMQSGGSVAVEPVTLTLPGCEAAGEFLLLQNLFGDLRLAGN